MCLRLAVDFWTDCLSFAGIDDDYFRMIFEEHPGAFPGVLIEFGRRFAGASIFRLVKVVLDLICDGTSSTFLQIGVSGCLNDRFNVGNDSLVVFGRCIYRLALIADVY